MALWINLAGLTVIVLIALSWPLWRPGSARGDRAAHDSAVYRDQLSEIEADLDRGLVGDRDAEAAKIEISRRLLNVADRAEPHAAPAAAKPRSPLALAGVFVTIPLLSVALYLNYGSPELPDQPHAARLAKPTAEDSFAALVAKVEARLRANPADGMGWDVLAPVYLKTRRYQEAADAYRRAITILGETNERLSGYAESLVMAENGIVPEAARKAFATALANDPERLKARFWLARAKEQDGRFAEAAEAWRQMLARGRKDAPWRRVVEEHLRVAEAKAGKSTVSAAKTPDTEAPAAPGPTAGQVAAAAQMTAAERAGMINQMVERLAARLEADGSDLQGWLRLVRAYKVLGKHDAARAALGDARRNFDKDSQALTKLNALAKTLGL